MVSWFMSKKIRQAARGEPCFVRLPGCQSGGENETSVLAHLPKNSMGLKANDLNASIACFSCHMALDGQRSHNFDKEWMELMFRRGQQRTIDRFIELGVIKI